MARTTEPLNVKHRKAIAMLTVSPRISRDTIARQLRVSRMTLWRWRQRPDFASEVKRIEDERKRKLTAPVKRRFTYSSRNIGEIEQILRLTGLLS